MREVELGSFRSERTRIAEIPWARHAARYVLDRQNEDGGYTFCQYTESNAQDTYYGLAILDLLEAPFPHSEQTLTWLSNFVPNSHYSHYYVAKALQLCNRKPHAGLREFLRSLSFVRGELSAENVYVEVASEFELAFMFTDLIKIEEIEIDRQKTVDLLLRYQNKDGGFGAHGNSSINSTYHVLASLFNLGYQVKSLHETLGYVRSCETPQGGFTIIPRSYNPYMEHTYYGVSSLELLNEQPRFPESTGEFVLKCQNLNGGFARSDLGISTFEDTFFAISVLKTINKL